LWIAHRGGAGLIVCKPEPATSFDADEKLLTRRLAGSNCGARSTHKGVHLPALPGEECRYTTADGLASDFILSGMYQSTDGRIWIGTAGGLTGFSDGRFRSYTAAQGLTNGWVVPVEDRDGNQWLASATGAM